MTGKERISKVFENLSRKKEKGLITFVTAGYPDISRNIDILKALADAGSDLIEIGIPFSDPVADGPVIQYSSYRALSGGLRIKDIYSIAGKLRAYTDIPVLFMTYYNPVMRAGLDNFSRLSAESGVDGLIIPDLPVDEDDALREAAGSHGLSLIPLVAPTTTDGRMKKIAAKADGFIYCVSVTGVTGKSEINTDLDSFSKKVRQHTDRPLALGFGISGPELARRFSPGFDAVVVGSAIVKLIRENPDPSEAIKCVAGLASRLKDALKTGGCGDE
ncbi:MAG: tryptophan synthase subunit alpha [Bacillota bacterium]